MATHTDNGGGGYVRRFSISRENGLVNKEGRPYFFEWIKELPADAGKRKFETRNNGKGEARFYELFSALDGILTAVKIEEKDLGGDREQWLCLYLTDGTEDYKIEAGAVDGRYSMDIMKRLLDPNFQPNLKLRLSPYAIANGDGKQSIGLSAHSGVDGKLSASYTDNPALTGCPQATSTEHKGKKLWDFSGIASWLYSKLEEHVLPNLKKDPISGPTERPTTRIATNITGNAHSIPFPVAEVRNYENNAPELDSLPF